MGKFTIHYILRLPHRTDHLEEKVQAKSKKCAEEIFRQAHAGEDLTIKLVSEETGVIETSEGSLANLYSKDPEAFRRLFRK